MAINGVSSSNVIRFGGLATGLDTDAIIKQLMDAEKIPLFKLQQKKTVLEWKKDQYRDITNTLRSLKDTYFDVLKPTSNMVSSTAYKKYNVSSGDSSVVTATAGTSAVTGSHTIENVTLATAAATGSTAPVSKELEGAAYLLDYTGANQLQVTLNGVTKTITLRNGAYATVNDLINDGTDGLQTLLNNAFGAAAITVTENAGTLKLSAANSKLTLSSGTPDALAKLGFTSGASNRINLSSKLQDVNLATGLAFAAGKLDFTINSKSFSIDQTKTVSEMMTEINNSDAGVTISYSELSDEFTITAKSTGAGNNLTITNTGGNLFGAGSAINLAGGTFAGTDASLKLDGVNITRSSNNFTVDGVNYSLKADYAGAPISLGVTQDVDGIYNNIKAFVDKYNEVVSKINGKLEEKRYRDYVPLTDEQKKDMEEGDIKLWEDKAKSGLLRSDSILQKSVGEMRRALFDPITGVSGTLKSIGIDTGDYRSKGTLIIDETKLRNAIQTNPDQVEQLFNKTSTIAYSPDLSAADRKTRYDNSGVAQRLLDVLQDNIRTSRNTAGKKGILLEKAGIVGDITEFANLMDNEIQKQNSVISNLEDKLYKKESRYYKRFAALEKAISQLNSQGSWMAQQFGGQG